MKIKLLVLGVLLCVFSGCMLFSSNELPVLELNGDLNLYSYNYRTDDENNFSLKENDAHYKLIKMELTKVLSEVSWRPTIIVYSPNIVIKNNDSSINLNFLSDHVLILSYKKANSQNYSQYFYQRRDVNKKIINLLKVFIKNNLKR